MPSNVTRSWAINWFGDRLPIPTMNYSEVLVGQSGEGQYVFSLKGNLKGQPVKILIGRSLSSAPMEDVFAGQNPDGGNQESGSSWGKALTQTLFGGPVKNSDLVDLGYRHTPADLSCAPQNWQKEMPIQMGLVLKAIPIPGGETKAIYEIDRGVVMQNVQDSQETWRAQWDADGFSSDAIIRLPPGHPYGPLGLAVGQPQAAPNPPQWLGALEIALAKPERQNWLALVAALKQAGMPEKNVKAVQTIADRNRSNP